MKEKIATDEFKPNCALVVLDFMIRHGLVTPDNGEVAASMIFYFVVLLPSCQLTHTGSWFNQTNWLWVIWQLFFLLQNLIMSTLYLDLTDHISNVHISVKEVVHLTRTQLFPWGKSLYINCTQCHNQEKRKNFMTVEKWQRAITSMSLKQLEHQLKLKENKETINKLLKLILCNKYALQRICII